MTRHDWIDTKQEAYKRAEYYNQLYTQATSTPAWKSALYAAQAWEQVASAIESAMFWTRQHAETVTITEQA